MVDSIHTLEQTLASALRDRYGDAIRVTTYSDAESAPAAYGLAATFGNGCKFEVLLQAAK